MRRRVVVGELNNVSRYLLVVRCILVALAASIATAFLLKFAENNFGSHLDIIKPVVGLAFAIILARYSGFPLMKEFDPSRKEEP